MTRPGMPSPGPVAIWLVVCCVLVLATVLLGGAVRLTGSGLSMVDWKPLMGVVPPMDARAWAEVFEQYKAFPEYRLVYPDMDLEGFKFIYYMEYSHRVLGRVIGIVFFVPFLVFLCTGKLVPGLPGHLWLLLLLGAVQGLIGWYMVQSGLVDNPRVSQHRLALHMLVAVLIYAYMVRIVCELVIRRGPRDPVSATMGKIALAAVLLMIVSGAFVAGTKAGFIFNTFPKMGADWVPDQMMALSPGWRNFLENPVAIQFLHRLLAVGVLIAILGYARQLGHSTDPARKTTAGCLVIAVAVQLGLGIATLLSGVPPVLGVAHQAGAMLLLTVVVVGNSLDGGIFPKDGRQKDG
ncbi:MAG: COX15/CtaA family protein [Gammaproteobacteria bacterium]|nr:COX15/CtaA family protein [Gammaproteobacteria bacterium]